MTLAPADTPADDFSEASHWLRGQYRPVTDELDVADLRVTGELPDTLRGTFLRNGPNSAFPPLGGYHIFDGDGMLHGVHFPGDGTASYRNRWIRSRGLEAELAAGHALYGGLGEFRLPAPEIVAEYGMMKNTANTHVVNHAGRTLALMEAAPPTEVDAELATIGEYHFGGALKGSMTAHPKIDPVTGEMVFFGYSPMAPYLRVHSASAEGTLTWSTEVELPGPVMMHDFVVTETRVLIFDLPAAFDLEALLAGGQGIRWAPERGARIGVLDRGAPGDTTRWIEVEPFWVFHFLNAHDEVTGGQGPMVAYGCRAGQLNAGFGPDDTAEDARPVLHRWWIDPDAGVVRDERVGDQPGDFPRIDSRRAGRDARFGYLGRASHIESGEIEFDGVVKHDLHSGGTRSVGYGLGTSSGEPVFTHDPDGSAEDDGWLLNWVHDKATGESAMVVLDADTLEEVARVHAPRRVPFGFHGSFVPE